jgi:hypothetical protein
MGFSQDQREAVPADDLGTVRSRQLTAGTTQRPKLLLTITAALLLLALGLKGQAQVSTGACPEISEPMVVVERLQGGIAGASGERTTIGVDGCFTVESVLEGQVLARLRAGRIGPERLDRAREALDEAGFDSLPERTGAPSPVNPATFSVTRAGMTKTLLAPAGAGLEDLRALGQRPAPDPTARLARLVTRLLDLTG